MSDTLKAAAATVAIPVLLALVWVFAQRGGSRQPRVGTARAKLRTLRISNIPGSISKSDFEAILARVAVEVNAVSDAADRHGLLGWSFAAAAHSEGSFVATATFRASPAPVQLDAAIRRSAKLDWGRLRVDMDFFGLTPLADPTTPAVEYVVSLSWDACRSGNEVLDYPSTNCLCGSSIIAVTGLAGHAFGSWVSRNEPSMWLRDFLPESIAKARILSYGYDTKLPGSRSTASILELSRKFLESVKAVRGQQEKYRPIVFIGHSLGGLVVKQALVQAAEGSQDDIAILMSCYAVVFFGVPNRGLNTSSLTSMVSGQPNEDLVRNLDPSSGFLGLLHEMFYRHFTFDDSQIVCFYETKETPTVEWSEETCRWERTGPRVMMVPKVSAIHAGKNEQAYNHLPIDADHSDMVKFDHPSDQNYIIVKKRIEKLADDAPGIIKERIAGHNKKLSDIEAKYVRDLDAPNYAASRDKVTDPVPGTFQWFLKDKLVRSWISNDESSLLWIRGSPGQGKTVLSKFLLNHLDIHPPDSLSNAKVIYFFCYDQDERFRTATSVLRSLIKQLLTSNLFHHITEIFDTDSSATRSEDRLWEILRAMFHDSSFGAIYCIIDALDECDEGSRKRLLSWIKILTQPSPRQRRKVPTLKLLIASRPIMDITTELNCFPCIDLKANPDDLKLVIECNVRELCSLSPNLQEKATELLLAGAGQTFLWVSIVLKKLRAMALPSLAGIREVIETSPKDLDELYQSIVNRIMEGRVEEQKLLTWVVYSRRPLTLKELEAALATQMSSKTKASTDEYRIDLTDEAVTSAVGVILHIIDNKVHLIHQSAKDFLIRNQQLKFAGFCDRRDPNIYLAKVCIIYLSFKEFEIGPCGDQQALAARKSLYPLLHYAARNWHTHIRGREDIDEVSPILRQLIKPQSPTLLSWSEAAGIPNVNEAKDTWGIAIKASIAWLGEFRPSSMTITEEKVKEAAENRATGYEVMKKYASESDTVFTEEAIYEIARSFDGEMMRLLLDRNDCITITPTLTKAAAANRKNGDSVIRLLLDLSKDMELTADLVEVAAKNQESGREVIELLLHKENIKVADGAGESLVEHFDARAVSLLPEGSCFRVSEAVVETVTRKKDHGKEVMRLLLARDDICLTEGVVAAIPRQFDAEVVELLLRRNDAEIGEGIVVTVAWRFDAKIMRLLLEREGYVKITEAVVEASAGNKNNGKEVMRLLLARDDICLTEGAVAAIPRQFDAEVVELLLRRNDVEIGEGIVVTIARQFDTKIMRLLLEKTGHAQVTEAVVEASAGNKNNGKEVIELLFSKGRIRVTETVVEAATMNMGSGKEVVEFLLGTGDILIVEMIMKAAPSDMKRGEPLSRSAENGHKVVVRLLLEKYGIHPDSRDRKGRTPLSWAAQNGHIEIVERLLAANADVNAAAAKDGGRTALQAAAGGGHLKAVERLLAANADVNAAAAKTRGWTALQAAARGGHLEVVERLLAANADVNAAAADDGARTALQAAAGGGHLEVIERLLAANADVNAAAAGWDGRTALQAAAEGGHLEVVERLLAVNADVNAAAAGWDGRTALQAAAGRGRLGVVERLLAANADVNAAAAEDSGRTALQAAAEGGHPEVVERLKLAINGSNSTNHPAHHLNI